MIFFANESVTIYRNRRNAVTNHLSISATFTSYNVDIQPADPTRVEIDPGRFGATYTAFVDSTLDIKENDELRTTTKKYAVRGVSIWGGAGLLDHKELTLISQDGNG